MSHVDEGALHAYLDGALDEYPAADADRIRSHLDACGACAARLEVERRVRADAHAMLGLAAPVVDVPSLEELRAYVQRTAQQRRGISRIQRMGWAASVVVALGVGWMLRDGQLQSRAMDIGVEVMPRAGVSSSAQAPAEAFGDVDAVEAEASVLDERARTVAGSDDRSDEVMLQAVAPDETAARRQAAPSAPAGEGTASDPELSKIMSTVADASTEARRAEEAVPPQEEPVVAALLPETLDRLEQERDAPVMADAVAAPADAAVATAAEGEAGLMAGEAQRGASADSALRRNEEAGGTRARESATSPSAVVANAARNEPALAGRSADADATAASLVVEVGASDDEAVAEPLLSVPGHEVIDVTNLGEGSTPWGARVRQRTDDGRAFEVFHLEPGIDPSILPPLEPGVGEATTETPFGWVLVRGGMDETELRGLLMQLFPESP